MKPADHADQHGGNRPDHEVVNHRLALVASPPVEEVADHHGRRPDEAARRPAPSRCWSCDVLACPIRWSR